MARRGFAGLAVFTLLELWVHLSAFADPAAVSALRVAEGPLALVALFWFFYWTGSYLKTLRRGHFWLFLWLMILPLLILLGSVPLSPWPQSPWRVEVKKSERTLTLFRDGVLVSQFPVALGPTPIGDKRVMGDGCTPLGAFRICDKGYGQFHKWLGLTYPDSEDAWLGRKEGRITWAEFWYIRFENLNSRIPFGNSALGGAIGIHGGGAGKNWTLGCVALENADIDTFFDQVPLGAIVEIKP